MLKSVSVLARKPTFHWPIKKGEEAIALRFACNFKDTDGVETVKMISVYKKKPIAFAKCSSDDKSYNERENPQWICHLQG